jgi:hypothetical protein
LAELMRQTRHRSTEVALGYVRPADLWRNNVTARVLRSDEQPRLTPALAGSLARRMIQGSPSHRPEPHSRDPGGEFVPSTLGSELSLMIHEP